MKLFGINKLAPYLKRYSSGMIIMILLGLLSSVADSLYPLFNRYAINHFIALKTMNTVGWFLLIYISVIIIQVFCNIVSSYLIGKVELYIGRDLKNATFNHLQTLSFSYFNKRSVGYIHARVMSDTDKIATAFTWRIMDLVWSGSYIIFVFIVMLLIDVRLTAYLLILIPVAFLLTSFFQKRIAALSRRVRELNSVISADFNEGITGAKTIKTLVIEDKIHNDFKADTEKMRSESVRKTRSTALFGSLVGLMSSIALALVLWRGGSLTVEGIMEIGTLSVFMAYALDLMDPIQNVISAVSTLIDVQVNIERTFELLSEKSDVNDTDEVIEKYGDSFNPKKENWEELQGDVEFRDVSFRYPDGDELVLSHFNLKVKKGECVAIVGETGAGKSTLINLVCRFFEPTEGSVLIDGRDARERSQLWLHTNIGYVLQTPHLFSGTVRDNVRYGKPDATDEEIWDALRIVAADEVVRRMDKGLDSICGEGGDLLSTGEKQLISFARAIISNPSILVLDEATSSIDTVTEKQIQDAIRTVTSGRTSFMVAHRLSTVVDADMILAVREGKIIESGTHGELMAKKGYYYNLYTRQYEDAETEGAIKAL